MKKGFLITLEGNEGCGKSTQIQYLNRYLRKRGFRTYVTREPGGTRVSQAVRTILLDNKNKAMTPVCETMLYMAARAQLVEEVILPKLKSGTLVLCDRWLDATVAYQGYGSGVDRKWIHAIGRVATRGVSPKLTLLLDLPLTCGLRRAKSFKKADRMEEKALAYHRKVRAGYLRILKAEPRRVKRIAIRESDTIWVVSEKIKNEVDRVLGRT